MTLNAAIIELVILHEHPMMPAVFKPSIQKIIETVSECEEPSVQRWIPCSARLPEIGKKVLLSEPNTMFIAEYHGSGDPEGLWLVDGCHHYLADVNECAWMPLPEPYKEET